MRLRRAATEARAFARVGARSTIDTGAEPLEDVREAVRLLPPTQREAVLLHYVDGLSCSEIAAALGSTPGAVRVRLHRARAELRSRLVPTRATPLPRKEIPLIEMSLDDVIVRVDADEPSKLVWDQRIVVLREKDGDRVLPIWIGAGEGNALAVRLRDTTTPRPLGADLMSELVRTLGGSVDRVAVTRLEESVFYASVTVDGRELDARPSDAINLAVRTGAPIVAAPEVLDEAAVVADALRARKLDADRPGVEVPPGEWRSLSRELLDTLFRQPEPK
jgi:bifunctional DNase/RNase